MVKFSVTIKDDFSDIAVEGDSEKEVLDKLQNLKKLKTDSDKTLGFDIKIPKGVRKKMLSLTNAEQIMVLLYYGNSSLTRAELHNRNNMMSIKENWWDGRNFTRDIGKKIEGNFIIKTEGENPKYKLTTNGTNYVRENLLDEKMTNEEVK